MVQARGHRPDIFFLRVPEGELGRSRTGLCLDLVYVGPVSAALGAVGWAGLTGPARLEWGLV
ncbi:hypothetical protein GCM10023170_097700 [Phytohabitans houttuyneae]|uniref:Uncharacterized protein n=1 Tax=Phytohabitans houttuyneae TaxID=1076126 RepID=A0A6V8KST4_9ACTN|nr:hypothetical protein Phou_078450 [Phytohabitans houttuyneae]